MCDGVVDWRCRDNSTDESKCGERSQLLRRVPTGNVRCQQCSSASVRAVDGEVHAQRPLLPARAAMRWRAAVRRRQRRGRVRKLAAIALRSATRLVSQLRTLGQSLPAEHALQVLEWPVHRQGARVRRRRRLRRRQRREELRLGRPCLQRVQQWHSRRRAAEPTCCEQRNVTCSQQCRGSADSCTCECAVGYSLERADERVWRCQPNGRRRLPSSALT